VIKRSASDPPDPLPSLLADDALAFSHFIVAATCSKPVEALCFARARRLGANELRRCLQLLADGNHRAALRRRRSPNATTQMLTELRNKAGYGALLSHALSGLLDASALRTFKRQLCDLRAVFETPSDVATIAAIVARAHAEWVPASDDAEHVSALESQLQ
jgi:hypothetical protein